MPLRTTASSVWYWCLPGRPEAGVGGTPNSICCNSVRDVDDEELHARLKSAIRILGTTIPVALKIRQWKTDVVYLQHLP
jgi:hypothetical protein